jgi:hypothetical protein
LDITTHAVDDATIVGAGQCMVEAWYARAGRHDDEVTVLPSCNPPHASAASLTAICLIRLTIAVSPFPRVALR